MANSLKKLRTAWQKRAAYNAMLRELRAMTPAEARDLNIAPCDAQRIAARAVYGTA